MATLTYGPQNLEIEFEERVLAHLKVAVLSKLRRNEAFSLSWSEDASTGHGRSSVWLHPSVPCTSASRRRTSPGSTAPGSSRC
ncbi:hypothetical protein Q0F99_09270 [Rathayibacter oskolensis]|uniref:DUF7882 family protein n=1 Tax=Rathayibacter oskolensis TaxID=1891671 RepID=UPI00265FD5E6|nr:hypothetical protein [Rathayibacter oskolensis]WKK73021.1 hypothetical protein Q0F99_09270 [Rathayibacter oskolensis]